MIIYSFTQTASKVIINSIIAKYFTFFFSVWRHLIQESQSLLSIHK